MNKSLRTKNIINCYCKCYSNLAPEQPNYNCFEKDPEPVDWDETFDDYCKDYEGNIHYENAYVTSCCECIR